MKTSSEVEVSSFYSSVRRLVGDEAVTLGGASDGEKGCLIANNN